MNLLHQYRFSYQQILKGFLGFVVILASVSMMTGCLGEVNEIGDIDDALMKLKDRTFDDLVFIGVYAFFMGDDCGIDSSSIKDSVNEDSATPCAEDKNDALPVHIVSMKDFSIQAYEVSYQDFDIYSNITGKDPIATELINTPYRQENLPVTLIAWNQARAYCKWLGKQIGYPMDLPSEAQWESAARGGKSNCGYATNNGQIEFGVNIIDPKNTTHPMPIGSWAPNPEGIYDMTGNVDEWTLDLWHHYTHEPPFNPRYIDKSNQQGEFLRVTRGSGITDDLDQLKLYRRVKRDPDGKYPSVGFRCAVNHDGRVINKEKIELKK
jgi:formylglycine-generating enzyme